MLDAGVEPTLDESTVSQDAAREQTSVSPEESSPSRVSPEKYIYLFIMSYLARSTPSVHSTVLPGAPALHI